MQPPRPPRTPPEPTLVLYDCTQNGAQVATVSDCTHKLFRSTSRWLYPLFEVERYLQHGTSHNIQRCALYDKIVGVASAYLIIHLHLPVVFTNTASAMAMSLLQKHNVRCVAASTVRTIGCKTERMLAAERNLSVESAYVLLSQFVLTQNALHTAEQ